MQLLPFAKDLLIVSVLTRALLWSYHRTGGNTHKDGDHLAFEPVMDIVNSAPVDGNRHKPSVLLSLKTLFDPSQAAKLFCMLACMLLDAALDDESFWS